MQNIGVIGLGDMGSGLAKNLIKKFALAMQADFAGLSHFDAS
jgi:3-hydroxyisobutyrate dehydrogenase-like beta-hydroxyacid dehydrogenase